MCDAQVIIFIATLVCLSVLLPFSLYPVSDRVTSPVEKLRRNCLLVLRTLQPDATDAGEATLVKRMLKLQQKLKEQNNDLLSLRRRISQQTPAQDEVENSVS